MEVLSKSEVSTVVLVTDATQMPRAKLLFERAGMTVHPAPTGFATEPPGGGFDLPSAHALERSAYAIREWLALSVLRLR